ncbi:glycosyltransferase [Flavobacterium pectinovorum]|uniref:glycosyltransferase n=1 Tax=Flavobacterium pectinovorum TaxID=29533 RepID=UPI001FACEA9D|nr:glycosyltransferase [Flavobacterium pectinovorum]MCI9845892.1 glycosyltransferase [Flavobacterium pectinovorum]
MSDRKSTFKIALIGDCLAGGGAEKVHATLSTFFFQNKIEVHNVIFIDWVTYDFSGELVNLGKMKSVTILDKLKRLYFLKNYLLQNKFDFIIDFRYRVNAINEILISYLVYKSPTIYTVHSGIIENYIPKSSFLANLIYGKQTIVTVSKSIENILKKNLNSVLTTIYNPFDIDKIQILANEFIPEEKNYILAVGRMNEKVKQFDKLIEAYSISTLPNKEIKLLIIGEGKYLEELKELVFEKKLQDKVIFKNYQSNPHPYQKKALFTVVSSKNEGFPSVIIESLIVETPVVSFDCFCGPGEIIVNYENGVLVENQNIMGLAQAMDEMVENKLLYSNCKKNALQSVTTFSVANIGKQWLNLMQLK